MQIFHGFEATDFEAYAPSKWQSNAFNLERMRVKDKLISLGREISPLHPSPGSPPLSMEASVEHPALWNNNTVSDQQIYFTRSEAERRELSSRNTRSTSMSSLVADPSPFREHMLLCISVAHPGAEVSLRLHPNAAVDRENMLSKLADRWHMQSLVDLLNGLPPAFLLGLTGEEHSPATEVDGDQLRGLLQRFSSAARDPGDEPRVFTVAHSYPKDDVCDAGPSFLDQAREALQALLPLYFHLAWTRQNDFVEAKEAIREDKKAKLTRGIQAGDTIRVTRGLFAGKIGVVDAADAKGQLKIRLGTMSVKLDAKDVVLK